MDPSLKAQPGSAPGPGMAMGPGGGFSVWVVSALAYKMLLLGSEVKWVGTNISSRAMSPSGKNGPWKWSEALKGGPTGGSTFSSTQCGSQGPRSAMFRTGVSSFRVVITNTMSILESNCGPYMLKKMRTHGWRGWQYSKMWPQWCRSYPWDGFHTFKTGGATGVGCSNLDETGMEVGVAPASESKRMTWECGCLQICLSKLGWCRVAKSFRAKDLRSNLVRHTIGWWSVNIYT